MAENTMNALFRPPPFRAFVCCLIALGTGGVVSLDDSDVALVRVVFTLNIGEISGGILFASGGSTIAITEGVIDRNAAGSGGAFDVRESAVVAVDSTSFVSNGAQTGGIAFLSQGTNRRVWLLVVDKG